MSEKGCLSCLVGKFESFHTGHRKLISEAKKLCPKVKIFSIDFSRTLLFTKEERKLLADSFGAQIVFIPFEEIKDMDADKFLHFLSEEGCRYLLAGVDWRFGKNREGDVDVAKKLGKRYGIEFKTVSLIEDAGNRVSTTRILELLKTGKVELANKLLGFKYFTLGKTVRGKGIGKKIGFPTINIQTEKDLPIPNGVYEVVLKIGGFIFRGIANYGVRPTVNGKDRLLEVHIPEKSLDVVEGERVKVEFVRFLRPEKRFGSLDELREQIRHDIEKISGR